jgi:flagellar biosynthesis/type III secretory pathway protein FliH
MSENLEDLNTELSNAFEITLIPNPLRERGFLFIETPSGQINASIDTQLKNLKEHLMKVAEKKYE